MNTIFTETAEKDSPKENLKSEAEASLSAYSFAIKNNGVMGVPISFLDKYCPDQFEIIGATESEGRGFSGGLWDEKSSAAQALVQGEKVYKRIFIRKRTKI